VSSSRGGQSSGTVWLPASSATPVPPNTSAATPKHTYPPTDPPTAPSTAATTSPTAATPSTTATTPAIRIRDRARTVPPLDWRRTGFEEGYRRWSCWPPTWPWRRVTDHPDRLHRQRDIYARAAADTTGDPAVADLAAEAHRRRSRFGSVRRIAVTARAWLDGGMSMTGRVALVTGGGHGIGRATVRMLRARGAHVAAADVDLDAARSTADDDVLPVPLDVTSRASVDAGIARCVEHFGGLDCLVCTAGGDRGTGDFTQTSDEDWAELLDLNLVGVVRCVRAAIPHLAAGTGGSVVIVGSINGLLAFNSEPYSSAKAGLGILTKNLAASLGPRGIRVNLVAPGTIRTRVWDGQPGGADRLAPLYPLGRVGEPEDVAAAITFLASDDAAWITGVTLPVDGGVSTGPAAFPQLLGR
jgi:meso-butanediol dehydrogenase / (S,S)-butanediol dehydrogenase / diacetyl reductase